MYTSKPPDQADDYLPSIEECCAGTLSVDRGRFNADVSWQEHRARQDSVSVYVHACIALIDTLMFAPVSVLWLFFTALCACLQCVIVVFPDHTQLRFVRYFKR